MASPGLLGTPGTLPSTLLGRRWLCTHWLLKRQGTDLFQLCILCLTQDWALDSTGRKRRKGGEEKEKRKGRREGRSGSKWHLTQEASEGTNLSDETAEAGSIVSLSDSPW